MEKAGCRVLLPGFLLLDFFGSAKHHPAPGRFFDADHPYCLRFGFGDRLSAGTGIVPSLS
jgi:hypothetical protein